MMVAAVIVPAWILLSYFAEPLIRLAFTDAYASEKQGRAIAISEVVKLADAKPDRRAMFSKLVSRTTQTQTVIPGK